MQLKQSGSKTALIFRISDYWRIEKGMTVEVKA